MEIKWKIEGQWVTNKPDSKVTQGVLEDSAERIGAERRFNSVIDEIVDGHERDGGFENLEGKGQPLQLEEDVMPGEYFLNKVLKNANVLPPWLELSQEIRGQLERLLSTSVAGQEISEEAIVEVNGKIRKYNQICPTPILQKRFVSKENLEQLFKTQWT